MEQVSLSKLVILARLRRPAAASSAPSMQPSERTTDLAESRRAESNRVIEPRSATEVRTRSRSCRRPHPSIRAGGSLWDRRSGRHVDYCSLLRSAGAQSRLQRIEHGEHSLVPRTIALSTGLAAAQHLDQLDRIDCRVDQRL